MKKIILLLILLGFTSLSTILGQETNQNRNWSISASYSPITTFYYYHPQNEYEAFYSKGVREIIYPIGFNVALSRRISSRLTLSSGFQYKARPNESESFTTGISPYWEKVVDNRYLFEIPVSITYRIFPTSKVIHPYISSGLRNSYFKRYYVGEYSSDFSGTASGIIDNHDGKFILFYQLGAGANINVYRSFSFMVSSNLTYSFSGFGYLEFQSGLNYSF